MKYDEKKYINKHPLDQNHWETNLSFTPKPSNSPAEAFCAKPGKDRPCTHIKTNELDH